MRRALAAAVLCLAPIAAHAETWFAAVDPYAQPSNLAGSQYMELFKPGAPWDGAAAVIRVFKTSTQFLGLATDAEVSAMISGLRQRRIALAMEGLLLVESERCGRGVESYGGRGAVPALAERLKRLGGELSFVAMDEPLWYGNYATGPRNCNDSPESLADQMAPNVQALKAAFPAVKFGDIEPINIKTPGRIDVMLQFAKAFRAATGEPISFFHADIIWQQPWRDQLADWKTKLHAAGIGLGVIVNGNPRETADLDWTNHAIERYRTIRGDLAISPDDVILQSWMPRPAKLLPDSEPGTLSHAATEIARTNHR